MYKEEFIKLKTTHMPQRQEKKICDPQLEKRFKAYYEHIIISLSIIQFWQMRQIIWNVEKTKVGDVR
jgi:hypothetical protein